MNIIQQSPKVLIPYLKNSRKHSDDQIKRIENSLQEFGFTNPVLVDTNNIIIAGHARVQAALNLGYMEVPTICLDRLTPTQIQAYIIADNRLAELSEWDRDLLSEELKALSEQNFDLSLLGWKDFKFENSEMKLTDGQEYKARFEIVVECEDEMDQEAIYKLMISKGYKCRILSM